MNSEEDTTSSKHCSSDPDPAYASEPVDFKTENQQKLDSFLLREDAAVLIHPLVEEGFSSFIEVNEVAIERYGYSRDEFLKLTAADITNPMDSVRHALRPKRSILREKRHLITLSEHITKTGKIIPVEIDAMVIPHMGRDLIVAVVHDLDERRNFERKLIASENRFYSILEKSADPMFLADLEGQFHEVNQAACVFLGYSRGELLEMTIQDLDPNHTRSDFVAQWEHVQREGGLIIETNHRKKDGEIVPVEVHIAALHYNGIKTMLGTARDLTQRKEQARKLKQSEYRFRALLQSVKTLAVQGYYGDGTIFFWNDANEAIYGYTAEEAIGKNLVDLIIPSEMKAAVRQAISDGGKTGVLPGAEEIQLQRKDGSGVWVYSSHVAVKIDDQFELYCLDVDLSAMKEAERKNEIIMQDLRVAKEFAEQANKAKDDFLAVMSHEMRTPLNPIIGFASLMMGDCREDQKEAFQIIINSGNRLLDLIKDILDFARFERGNHQLKPEETNLTKLCDTALTDIKEEGSHLSLSMENGFESFSPIPENLIVMCDQNALLRVLDNLLVNACKYTESGSVKLQYGMKKQGIQGSGFPFVFQVSDTGLGIHADHIPSLFDPFYQEDSSYTRKKGGVGLGLSVCKKIIELMHGSIGVRSEEGKGSTFRIEVAFPLSETDSVDSNSVPSLSRASSLPVSVLIVEDEDANAKMLGGILTHYGATCVYAENGVEAVEQCEQQAFDVILMDLHMPLMDGFQATEQILQQCSKQQNTTIIALSANVSQEVIKRCHEIGMAGFISKPIEAQQLVKTVSEYYRASDQ